MQEGSSKLYRPHQTAFIQYLVKNGRSPETATPDDVVEFLMQWSCDYTDAGFVVNPQSKAAFASGRSAVRNLFVSSKLGLPYDENYLRMIHRAIKLECAIYAVKQAPPLGCFDLRHMVSKLLDLEVRQ